MQYAMLAEDMDMRSDQSTMRLAIEPRNRPFSEPASAELLPDQDEFEATVKIVRRIWEKVLKVGSISPTRPYHELGRGVVRAILILKKIEEATGVVLPITIFASAPTIRGMAEAIVRKEAPPFSRLVLLKEGHDGAPLFIFPGLGGLVFELFDLAQAISFPGAVYGLQPKGLDHREEPETDFSEMVRANLEAVRSAQPRGPYRFVGYSLGGSLALELARSLTAEGEEVAFLGLVAPGLHDSAWPWSVWLKFIAMRVFNKFSRRIYKQQTNPSAATQAAPDILSRPGKSVSIDRLLHRFCDPHNEAFLATSPYHVSGLPPTLQKVRDQALICVATYKPEPYHAKATYFESALPDSLSCDPRDVWPRIIPGLEFCVAPGDHQSMIRPPHVRVLASMLSDRLGRA